MRPKIVRTFKSIPAAQENSFPEKPKTIARPKKASLQPGLKLSKSDPDYFSKIGKISAQKRLKRQGTQYFSEIAKLSHPRGPGGYHGGRPKKKEAGHGVEDGQAT